MKIITRKIFLGANTPDGYVGFYDQIVDNYDIKKMYILKGGNGTGKSTFIKNFTSAIIKHHKEQNKSLTVDFIMCSADPSSYDGAILHEPGISIIDGTHPHIVDPKYPTIIEEIIDLSKFLNPQKLSITKDQLQRFQKRRHKYIKLATQHFNTARQIHFDVEAKFSNAMDFDALTYTLSSIIKNHTQ